MMIKKPNATLVVLIFILFSIFNITNCYASVSVGDSYGGGTVFCVSDTEDTGKCKTEGSGDYGLIMANEDQANYVLNHPKTGVIWASKYDTIIPAARSDDDGAANTAAIIAALPLDTSLNSAAWLCHNYRDKNNKGQIFRLLNDEIKILIPELDEIVADYMEYDDWYLPSKNELNKMYIYAKAHNLIGKDCAGRKAGGVQCLVGGYSEQDKIYWSSTDYAEELACGQRFSSGDQPVGFKSSPSFGVRAIRTFNSLQKPKILQGVGLKVMAGDSLNHAAVSSAFCTYMH